MNYIQRGKVLQNELYNSHKAFEPTGAWILSWGDGSANHSTSRHWIQLICDLQTFFQSIFVHHSLNNVFCRRKVLISTICHIFLSWLCFWCHIKELCLIQAMNIFFHIFFCKFKTSVSFKFLYDTFYFNFVRCENEVEVFLLVCFVYFCFLLLLINIQIASIICQKDLLSSLHYTSVKNQLAMFCNYIFLESTFSIVLCFTLFTNSTCIEFCSFRISLKFRECDYCILIFQN